MAIKTNIEVNVKSGKASANLKKLKKDTDGLSRSSKGLGKDLGVLRGNFAALGGVAIAGAIVALGKATLAAVDFGDNIAKTADKLGISTDALQEYRFAAEQTGLTTTQLDVGIQRFTRRLAEAADGAGVLAPVMKDLNIELRDSEGNLRSTEDVLNDYADAIQNADSSSQRLLLAFKAFDTEGVAFVNTLKDGSAGLQSLRNEAVDLGLIMDEALIRKAEIAADKWNILTTQIGVGFKSALLSVLGLMADLRTPEEMVASLTEELKDTNEEIIRLAANLQQIKNTGGSGEAVKKELQELTEKARELNAELSSAQTDVDLSSSDNNTNAAVKTEAEKNAELMAMATEFRKTDKALAELALIDKLESQAEIEMQAAAGLATSKALLHAQAIEQQKALDEEALKGTRKTLGSLNVLMSSSSKTLFNAGKAAALAGAIIDGYAAATGSFKVGAKIGGPPLGAIFAAASLVATGVQIQNIKKTKMSRAHSGLDRNDEERTILVKKDEMILDSGTSDKVRKNIDNATKPNAGGGDLIVQVSAIDTESFITRLGQPDVVNSMWNTLLTKMNEEGRRFA